MRDGQRKEAWDHTANLLAMIHNVNCLEQNDRITPLEAHPYREKRERSEPAVRISVAELATIYQRRS